MLLRFCRRCIAAAGLVDMHQQICDPTLDGFQIAKFGVGGIEPFDQLGNAVFEVAEGRVIGMRELNPFELFDQAAEQLFKLPRHGVARIGRGIERIGERIEATFQHRNGMAACRTTGETVHLGGQRSHVVRHLRQRVVGGDMRDDAAQRADCSFELLQSGRVFLGDNQIDLLRKRSHRIVESDQVLGGRQAPQCVAHFREPAEFIESIPFTETREYVQSVLRNAAVYRQLYGTQTPPPQPQNALTSSHVSAPAPKRPIARKRAG